MITNAAAVFLGGGFGALCRFLLSELVPLNKWGIPFTIISVNFLGCFLIGIFGAFFMVFIPPHKIRHFIITGFIGGFTTFSSVFLEIEILARNNINGTVFYVLLTIILPSIGFFIGQTLVKLIFK
ncbi:MAG: CrcB family protein [Elusimicrobiota bacterium]|jgi:CrcB protein|nr:CrcB family protein [Elusimicrobiota bacterium]